MKYYTYASLTKIEMLFDQLAASSSETEASLGFDIKVLKAEVKKKSSNDNNIYKKLQRISDALVDANAVGGLDDMKPYIKATLEMKFGGYGWSRGEDEPIAFWGYSTFKYPFGPIALALAGSSYHLIGERRPDAGSAHSHSLTSNMVIWFLQNLGDTFSPSQHKVLQSADEISRKRKLSEYDVANATFLAATQMSGEAKQFEFLAKVLHHSSWQEGFRESEVKRIILGTPLYVCMVD